MSVATRYTATFQEAEEVVNDAFVKVFTRIATHYSPDQSFKGWLRRIVINTAIDHYRRRDKLIQYDLEHAALVRDEDSVVDRITREQILELVQHLSPVRRMVFNMYVIEGYKHQEIAELMGTTEGASKSALSRAREDLRRLLSENIF
jgi:RNA polymerase sigma factor (sigma-70 family)